VAVALGDAVELAVGVLGGGVAGQQGQGASVAKELMVMNLVSVVVLDFVVWLHLTP
jgi:hypothetical protein